MISVAESTSPSGPHEPEGEITRRFESEGEIPVPQWRCPNGGATLIVKTTSHQTAAQRLALVVENLHKRGSSRPRTIKTLSSTIAAMFQKKLTEQEVSSLLGKLQAQGIVSVSGTKVSYALPPSAD